jgi:hypothetical protein
MTDAPMMSKAEFVRSKPTLLSVEEVVAQGKEAGLAINSRDVHSERYAMKVRANKKQSKPAKPVVAGMTKKEFVLSKPASMPVDTVIELAKKEGLTIARGVVWGVRSKLRRAKRNKGKPLPNGAPVMAMPPASERSNGAAHNGSAPEPSRERLALLLLGAARELGYREAISLLQDDRAKSLGSTLSLFP